VPNNLTIMRIINRFQECGSVSDRKRFGRQAIFTEAELADVEKMLQCSPSRSLRTLTAQSGISYGSAQKVTKKLHLHAYHVCCVQELKDLDKEKCSVVSDLHEKPLHCQKIRVWCAVSCHQVVGPIFFDTTVNSPVYQDIITQLIVLLAVDEHECWLQQDSATCHKSNETMQFLHEFFSDHIISKALWPLRSPDLSPADFFFWGYGKGIVYKNNPHTLDDLKRNITMVINIISLQVFHKVASNMVNRACACIAEQGSHFEHML
ncbi:hypothetical protein B7P43_G08721, partial [Cryptotermes secundus]